MKIEYGDFQVQLGWWAGLGLLFALGILADLISVVLTGHPIDSSKSGIYITAANATN